MNRFPIRSRDVSPDDVLDRIYKAWLAGRVDEDLELADRFILERMEFIDSLFMNGGERARYTNVVEETYRAFSKSHDVSRRTIQTDVARTKRFFLTTRPRDDKDYAKGMHIEWGLIKLAKLEEEGNDKEWNKLYKELGDLQRFKHEDVERPDYSVIQPPPLMVIIDPATIGVPVIDNLDEEIRILSTPKKQAQINTDNIEDAEVIDGGE